MTGLYRDHAEPAKPSPQLSHAFAPLIESSLTLGFTVNAWDSPRGRGSRSADAHQRFFTPFRMTCPEEGALRWCGGRRAVCAIRTRWEGHAGGEMRAYAV